MHPTFFRRLTWDVKIYRFAWWSGDWITTPVVTEQKLHDKTNKMMFFWQNKKETNFFFMSSQRKIMHFALYYIFHVPNKSIAYLYHSPSITKGEMCVISRMSSWAIVLFFLCVCYCSILTKMWFFFIRRVWEFFARSPLVSSLSPSLAYCYIWWHDAVIGNLDLNTR